MIVVKISKIETLHNSSNHFSIFVILDCSNAYENKDKEFVQACIQGCTNEKEVGREQVR